MNSTEEAMDRAITARPINAAERGRMVAEAAYYRALQRNFEGGDPLEDWYSAEREIDLMLLSLEKRRPASSNASLA